MGPDGDGHRVELEDLYPRDQPAQVRAGDGAGGLGLVKSLRRDGDAAGLRCCEGRHDRW
jgi:hypothetical protein